MHNKIAEPGPCPPGWVNFNEPLEPATYSQPTDAAHSAYTAESGKPAYDINMQHAEQYEGQYGGPNSGQYEGQYWLQLGSPPGTNTHMMSTSHTVTAQPNIVVINPMQQFPVRRAPDYMALSCFVFWCCNWVCGAVALLFSCMSKSARNQGDEDNARRYGLVSLGINICSIFLSIMLIIIIFVIIFKANDNTDYSSCHNYCNGECCALYEECTYGRNGEYCS